MTFTHKLARRLAVLRALPPHCAMLTALALTLACSAGVPTGVDTASNSADAQVVVNPRSLTLEANQVSVFKAYAQGVPGDSLVTSIEWTATGGTIALNGTYSSSSIGAFKVVGKRHGPNRTTSDTATVTVVPPQPSITTVVVSPTSATLPGNTQQTFSATGKLSDGSTVAIGVTWTATGGSIDAGGVYTAGSTAGSYQVIARAASAPVADTVAVTVTAPATAPVGPPDPNEPIFTAGKTVRLFENFDRYTTTAQLQASGIMGGAASLMTLDAGGGFSGPNSQRFTFPFESPAIQVGVIYERDFSPAVASTDNIFVVTWMLRTQPGYQWFSGNGQVGSNSHKIVVMNQNSAGGQAGRILLEFDNAGIDNVNYLASPNPGLLTCFPNLAWRPAPDWSIGGELFHQNKNLQWNISGNANDGNWHRYTARLTRGTSGAYDSWHGKGRIEMWVDGLKILEYIGDDPSRCEYNLVNVPMEAFSDIHWPSVNGATTGPQWLEYDDVRLWLP